MPDKKDDQRVSMSICLRFDDQRYQTIVDGDQYVDSKILEIIRASEGSRTFVIHGLEEIGWDRVDNLVLNHREGVDTPGVIIIDIVFKKYL